ncbi:putative phage tail protein [Mesorhizobium sp.]|uniref:putative phage tail protein n=1 Tax=Mesorhizobium sp. TaxID=1871066 RepID=UPI00257D0166|nr:putative phage tail protein [Mesorhizobium sp.]
MSDPALRWPRYLGEDEAAFFHFAPSGGPDEIPDQVDVLSDPDDETSGGFLMAVLPKGAAWGTPDNQALDPLSVLARFWRAIGSALGDAYRALFGVALESTAVTLVTSLDDWEIEYGLPDPCLGPDQTIDMRMRSLLLKIRSGGTITPGDFIKLAADAGYTIKIEEPEPFCMGGSDMGGDDELSGGDPVEYVWIVSVPNVPVYDFHMNEAEMGVTPFGDLGLPADLICLFKAMKPAWTTVIFSV